MKPTWTYFAADGSYGIATELVIIDTSNWDNDDWDEMTNSRDHSRAKLAEQKALDNADRILTYVEGVK